MAAGVSQPKSLKKSRSENEQEDEVPRSLFTCRASEVTNLTIVFTADDLKQEHPQRFFKPKLHYQVFGDSDLIFGYRNLSINIYFMANSANCLVDLKYNAITNSTNGPPPDDILKILTPWLPERCYTDKRQFLRVIAREDHTKRYGTVFDTFKIYNEREETTYNYIITHCSVSEPGFGEFHSRFESFIVWFIDAANQIEVDDPSWMFLYVYEQRVQPNGKRGAYYPIGYCTVYKFFHFPDKVRCRIAQVFILPPCQRCGIGIKLLQAAYKLIYELPNVIDIAVEDPCIDFIRMRDILDCQLLMQLDSFRYPAIIGGFTQQMFNEANAHFKLNKRQCRRAYEILRITYANSYEDTGGLQRVYKEIKSRIEAPFLREQEAVRKKRIVVRRRLSADDTIIYQPAETMNSITRNVEAYIYEIKTSAQLLRARLSKG